ncbi:4409_t:CDS:1, partial [Acaulospora colombiana]
KDLIIVPVHRPADNSLLTPHILSLAAKEALIPPITNALIEGRPVKRPRLDQDQPSHVSGHLPPCLKDLSSLVSNDHLEVSQHLTQKSPSNRTVEPPASLNEETATSLHLARASSGIDESFDRYENSGGYKMAELNNRTPFTARSPGSGKHSLRANTRHQRHRPSFKEINKQAETVKDLQQTNATQLHVDSTTPKLDYTSPGGVSSVFSDDALTPCSISEFSSGEDPKGHQEATHLGRHIQGNYTIGDGVYSP